MGPVNPNYRANAIEFSLSWDRTSQPSGGSWLRDSRYALAGVLALLLTLSSTSAPLAADTAAIPDSSLASAVETFVGQVFIHGVPYEEAHKLGPGALPVLRRLLENDAYRQSWAAIVATIAFIDAPGSYATLRAFLRERFEGEVDQLTLNALLNVPSVMGTLKSPEAMEDLVAGVDPQYWKNIRWACGSDRGPSLHLLLSKLSLNGLSYTGSKRAAEVLTRLKKHPYSKRQISNIEGGIVRNAEIASKGLVGWQRAQKGLSR